MESRLLPPWRALAAFHGSFCLPGAHVSISDGCWLLQTALCLPSAEHTSGSGPCCPGAPVAARPVLVENHPVGALASCGHCLWGSQHQHPRTSPLSIPFCIPLRTNISAPASVPASACSSSPARPKWETGSGAAPGHRDPCSLPLSCSAPSLRSRSFQPAGGAGNM